MVSWNTQNADIFHLEEQLIKAFFEKVALKKLLKKNLANNDRTLTLKEGLVRVITGQVFLRSLKFEKYFG